ncbi:MAG: heavy-metal-associated domain-containing protein [Bacteroidetes bacterium]|uniref:Heavy-metal-associated domain-containing protein n=1 Tax=Phaeocystidibacter marisrubri TaxID=1577780 RepID=A0A6L3ZIN9_9FLAO|nr:heavy metal-associated domain-containing protein [Phaeocystidibacter marisrubri]KAB2817872.1 heavy-metal-associated domain-containing protein [Phaeocystidibacter marisrubri]TNE30215.1 MAG: heavy-metal-associated domain-containing protein [Bacteroidota bacterium]GGH73099.1 hypothetical protein GCM10011318_17780 [Phaeocystidibacter marisrubri]
MKAKYSVSGMKCTGCQDAVIKALESVNGVLGVNVNLQDATAEIESQTEIDESVLRNAVKNAGYELQ